MRLSPKAFREWLHQPRPTKAELKARILWLETWKQEHQIALRALEHQNEVARDEVARALLMFNGLHDRIRRLIAENEYLRSGEDSQDGTS